jgi:hypothetical protein
MVVTHSEHSEAATFTLKTENKDGEKHSSTFPQAITYLMRLLAHKTNTMNTVCYNFELLEPSTYLLCVGFAATATVLPLSRISSASWCRKSLGQ